MIKIELTDDQLAKLDKLHAEVEKIKQDDAHAAFVGVAAAAVIKGQGVKHCSPMAKCLGAMLLDLEDTAENLDCSKLTHEWMMEHYWGARVAKAKPIFDEVYDRLVAIGATFNNRLTWGDLDHGIWAFEVQKPPRSGQTEGKGPLIRVIADECYCSCADDNIHLWIKDDWNMFRCRRCVADPKDGEVHPALKDWRTGSNIRRYSEYAKDPGLGYGDSRDTGYIWDWGNYGPRVKDALLMYHQIYWGLWHLDLVHDAAVKDKEPELIKNNRKDLGEE